jgi:alkaline phosphatase
MQSIKKTSKIILCAVVLSLLSVFPPHLAAGDTGVKDAKVKNVIVLMFDGQGLGAVTSSRWYKGGPLAIDGMNAAFCSVHTVNSIITDSAASATAFATGHKTAVGHLAVLSTVPVTNQGVPPVPEEKYGSPVATLLEGAKFKGKSTGLIATSFIQHASPAGYSSHTISRSDYEKIAEHQVYLDIDVVLGGGQALLLPEGPDGTRKDGENLVEVLKKKGYEYITNREELMKSGSKKLWGMFSVFQMAYELDRRQLYPEQPSLAEMTKKAIEILSRNPEGFFLFVEASLVDWAAHFNSPVGVIGDMLALDDAAAVALEFAKKNGDTQVFVFSDHDTGGMTIGCQDTDEIDVKLTKEMVFGPLKKAKLTGAGITKMLGKDPTPEKIIEIVGTYYGITDLTEDEIKEIANRKGRTPLMNILGPMLSKRAYIGWTTHGHLGNDVPVFYYGPARLPGHIDNTGIARKCAQLMGFDLEEITEKLFVDAETAFTRLGAAVSIDETDKKNPVLIAKKAKTTIRIPFHKNIFYIGTTVHQMPGIAVFNPKAKKLYIPEAAIELVKSTLK